MFLIPDSEIKWITYASTSSALQNPPTGAVKFGDLYVARLAHECGVWVGKLLPNGNMYVGLPDDSSGLKHQGAVQVIKVFETWT